MWISKDALEVMNKKVASLEEQLDNIERLLKYEAEHWIGLCNGDCGFHRRISIRLPHEIRSIEYPVSSEPEIKIQRCK